MKENKQELIYTFFYGIVAAAYAVLGYLSGGGDLDYLWHIKLGEFILKNKEIMKTDTFSWIAESQGWTETAHSWGSSIILYLFSLIPVKVEYAMAVFVGFWAFVTYAVLKRLFFKKTTYLCAITAVFVGLLGQNPRPQDISFPLFLAMVCLLEKTYREKEYKGWVFLPLLSLLWANIHGGSIVMLFAFEGLFLFFSLLPDIRMGRLSLVRGEGGYRLEGDHLFQKTGAFLKELRSLRDSSYLSVFKKFLAAFLGSILAGLINPYGWRLYYYFCVTNTEEIKKYIQEWQPARLGSGWTLVPLLTVFVCLAFSKKVRLEQLVPILCCLVLGAGHMRVLVYACIYCLPTWVSFFQKENYKVPKVGRLPVPLILSVLLILLSISSFSGTAMLHRPLTKEEAVYFEEAGYRRIYNTMNLGSPMIYAGIPCFIDSRGDLFSDECFTGAMEFSFGLDIAEDSRSKFLETYDFDGVALLCTEHSAITFMRQRTDYEQDFKDESIIVFKKK